MNIEKQLYEIGELMSNDSSKTLITETDILKFCENRLGNDKLGKLLKLISEDPILYQELMDFRYLISAAPHLSPPVKLQNQVLKKLKLVDSFTSIVMKRTKGLWEIIEGNHLVYQNIQPKMAFRGKIGNEVVFKVDESPYFILCTIDYSNDLPNIYFSLETDKSERVKNGRFTFRKGKKNIFEIVTDKMGVTSRELLGSGEYEIDVELNREKLGVIKLNLQE